MSKKNKKKEGNWFTRMFKASEDKQIEEALEHFDGFLEINTLAQDCAEIIIGDLEETSYSKKELKQKVEDNLPKFINLIKKRRHLLKLDRQIADVVNDMDDDEKDVKEAFRKNSKSKLSKEDRKIKEEIQEMLSEMKTEMKGSKKAPTKKASSGNGKGTAANKAGEKEKAKA